ncbi:MAG: sugar phosphate isomerase/epimerase [Clostridia bacterium]|nr:sugar phosphate isomerase/epimerase [Clostridia bacterium]
MRKIGMNLAAMIVNSENEMPAVIEKMAECGFNATFTGMFEMEKQMEIANLLSKHGIEYETLHAPSAGINNMWLSGEEGDQKLSQLCQCADHAHAAGAGIIIVHLSSGEAAPPVTDIGRERFTRLVEHAAAQNVRIAFENQRKVSNIAWAFETFPKESNVGFCWDCGHETAFAHGRQYMPLFGDRLICTHIHDNFGVFQQDKHRLPFDATFDFHRFARQINEYDYKGSLMLEVDYKKSPELYGDLSYLAFVERAAGAVKRLRYLVDGEME